MSERSFQSAAKSVCPDNPNLDEAFEACIIQGPSLDLAVVAVGHKDFPSDVWVTVPVTNELWPKAVWHNQRLTETDAAPIRAHQRKAARERALRLDNEAKEYRESLERARA